MVQLVNNINSGTGYCHAIINKQYFYGFNNFGLQILIQFYIFMENY